MSFSPIMRGTSKDVSVLPTPSVMAAIAMALLCAGTAKNSKTARAVKHTDRKGRTS